MAYNYAAAFVPLTAEETDARVQAMVMHAGMLFLTAHPHIEDADFDFDLDTEARTLTLTALGISETYRMEDLI